MNLKKIFYLLMVILIILFIFYNSLQNGQDSSEISSTVMNFINNGLAKVGIKFQFEGNFIRKFAHFVEFFLLGFFVILTFEAFTEKIIAILGNAFFINLLIPVIDEYIQTFSIGRTSLVADVLLDFFGATVGLIFAIIFIFIKNKFSGKKSYYKFNL